MVNPDDRGFAAVAEARQKLIAAALTVLSAQYGRESDPYYFDQIDYADDLLFCAARDMANAVQKCDRKPIGW